MQCGHCQAELTEGTKFCEKCGKEVGGIDEDVIALKLVPKLKKARGWILGIGILYAVSALLMVAISGVPWSIPEVKILLATNFALFAIHIGLWFWAKTAPFAAAVVALALFLTVHLVNAIIEPASLVRGILIKILFLIALAQAISAGLEVRRLRTTRKAAA